MILLLTSFPADSPSGGACIVRQFLQGRTQQSVHWIAVARPTGLKHFETPHVKKEHHFAPNVGNSRLRLERFWKWYYCNIWAPRLAKLIKRRIQSIKPEVIWVVLDYPLVPVVYALRNVLKANRLHVSVHDDPVSSAVREGALATFSVQSQALLDEFASYSFTADAVSEELLALTVPNASQSALVTLA